MYSGYNTFCNTGLSSFEALSMSETFTSEGHLTSCATFDDFQTQNPCMKTVEARQSSFRAAAIFASS